MNKTLISRKKIYFLSIIFLILDQFTKYLAIKELSNGAVKPLIPGFIQLRLVRNTGAAFSLFRQSTLILTLISLIVSIVLFIYLWRNSPLKTLRGISFSLLLGGTLGNGSDRILLGYVNDFIDPIIINFPIFNLADILINLAILGFLIDTIKKNKYSIQR